METTRRANKPPILITGAHRSGTTWVGRILAASSEVGLIYEPFNLTSNRPGVCNHKFENWFQYLSSSDDSPYRHVFDQTLSFKYSIRNEISALKTLRDVGRMARDWGKFSYYRFSHKRPVIKDPIALLSAPWLYNEFQCQVVLLVRHPAAFASSLKRLNWPFDFKYLLNQNALMKDYLGDYREEIEVFKDPSDVIGQAALLWKVLYSVVQKFECQFPTWNILRHEDLSRQPVIEFKKLFATLDLEFTDEVESQVKTLSSSDNPAEAPAGVVHQLQRDSRANIGNWKQRLTAEEIQRVYMAVKLVSSHFYTDADWDV